MRTHYISSLLLQVFVGIGLLKNLISAGLNVGKPDHISIPFESLNAEYGINVLDALRGGGHRSAKSSKHPVKREPLQLSLFGKSRENAVRRASESKSKTTAKDKNRSKLRTTMTSQQESLSNSSYLSGYINQIYCLDDGCTEPMLISTIVTGVCVSENITDHGNNGYYVSQVISAQGADIVVQVTEYSDSDCSEPEGNATIATLSTNCTYVGNTKGYIAPYSYTSFTTEVLEWGAGTLQSEYVYLDCTGELQSYWWVSDKACRSGTGTSSVSSCTQNGYAYVVSSALYSDSDTCEGSSESTISTLSDVCYRSYFTTCVNYPPVKNCINESEIVYNNVGVPAYVSTFAKCLENLGGDAPLFPGFAFPELTPMTMLIALSLNNLISIDSISNTITIDFMMYCSWTDPRLAMPAFFSLTPYFYMEITQLLGTQDTEGTSIDIWLPNLVFLNALSMEIPSSFVRLYDNGEVAWNQHIVLQLTQSSLNYRHYPKDSQEISIQFYSVSLFDTQLKFDTELGYMYSVVNYPNYSITENQIWTFESAEFTANTHPPGTSYGPRQYGLVSLQVVRQAEGIVLRLAFPVFMLVILAGLSFWADPEDRVDSTVTMLLAISALSIIVFGSIPMVGYLTTFDKFLTTMFVILTSCCVLHLFTIRLRREDKISKWPFRNVYVRMLEYAGRVIVLPTITLIYAGAFRGTISKSQSITSIVFVFIFAGFIAFREFKALTTAINAAMKDVGDKFEDLKDLSTFEAHAFNWFTYREFTASARTHMRHVETRRKELDKIRIKNAKSHLAAAEGAAVDGGDSDDEDVVEVSHVKIAPVRSSIELTSGSNPMMTSSI